MTENAHVSGHLSEKSRAVLAPHTRHVAKRKVQLEEPRTIVIFQKWVGRTQSVGCCEA